MLFNAGYMGPSSLITKPGIYAGYKAAPATALKIKMWAKDVPFRHKMSIHKDIHLTTVFSRKHFDFKPLGVHKVECRFEKFDIFGKDKPFLVALIDSPFLLDLFNKRKQMGAPFDFPVYQPHITLVKNIETKDLQGFAIKPFDFPIILTEEYSEPINLNKAHSSIGYESNYCKTLNRIEAQGQKCQE